MHVILYTMPLTPTLAQRTHDCYTCYVLCCYTATLWMQICCLMGLDAARCLDTADTYSELKQAVMLLPAKMTAAVRRLQQQIVVPLLAAVVCT
jgi:hypothetical protein